MKIKVSIIEDQKEIREMLSVIVKGHPDFELVSSFENGEDAVSALQGAEVDVVLVDIHLPGMSGIECVELLKKKKANTQFIMCTSLENSETVFAALKAGATGYLSKTTPPSKILESIVEVQQGGSPMSSSIARKVVSSFSGTTTEEDEWSKLSLREKEILDRLAKGLRYKEIAEELFISTETVRTHIRNIYEKLQVNSRTMAINKISGKNRA